MWSFGDPNCSEQASPALTQAQKTYRHLSLSLCCSPVWVKCIAFLSHFRGGRVARLVWTVANVQRLVLCSFPFHSVPRWTSQGKLYSLQSSSQRHGSESLPDTSDLFSISKVTREDLLTSFQKWRCLWLTAWLKDSSQWSQHQEPRCSVGSLLPSRQVTGLRLRKTGPFFHFQWLKAQNIWLFFFSDISFLLVKLQSTEKPF